MSRQTIVSIEAGDYSPSVYLALRVARELERTVEELFGPEPDDQDKAAPVSGQGSMKVEGR